MQRHSFQRIYPTVCVLAAAAFLAAAGATIPALADDTQTGRVHVILAAANPEPGQSGASASAARADERVEARIRDLHSRLGITAAQEGQWNDVTRVMRDNANTMVSLTQARTDQGNNMTAVDDLKSYAAIAQAHADGVAKFAPAFGALYDSMSDEQKQNADAIFRARGHKAMKRLASKNG